MGPVAVPWMVACTILTARSVKRDRRPPLPSEFVATFTIFGTASLFSSRQPQLAATFSWGVVIAMALNLWDTDGKMRLQPKPGSPVFDPFGDFAGNVGDTLTV